MVRQFTPVLIGHNIPLDPPPPPEQKRVEHPPTKIAEKIFVPPVDTHVTPPDTPHLDIDFGAFPVLPTNPSDGGSIGTVIDPPKHDAVMVGANIDPHYAGYFQPAYPADEIRAGNAGRVTVKVLIGVDGRVKDIEKVSAASDSFWEATKRQALSKWRFKPATRDGVPYETWKTMNVSFVLNQDQ